MATLYLANLGADPDKRKIEKEFSYFGSVRSVWLSRPPYGYGFVEMKHYRDGRCSGDIEPLIFRVCT